MRRGLAIANPSIFKLGPWLQKTYDWVVWQINPFQAGRSTYAASASKRSPHWWQ